MNETITVTPTWRSLVPVMLEVNRNAKRTPPELISEFFRMAEAADKWNEYCKEIK